MGSDLFLGFREKWGSCFALDKVVGRKDVELLNQGQYKALSDDLTV